MERKFKERGKSIVFRKNIIQRIVLMNLFDIANFVSNILKLYDNDAGYDSIRKSREKTEASLARNVY